MRAANLTLRTVPLAWTARRSSASIHVTSKTSHVQWSQKDKVSSRTRAIALATACKISACRIRNRNVRYATPVASHGFPTATHVTNAFKTSAQAMNARQRHFSASKSPQIVRFLRASRTSLHARRIASGTSVYRIRSKSAMSAVLAASHISQTVLYVMNVSRKLA